MKIVKLPASVDAEKVWAEVEARLLERAKNFNLKPLSKKGAEEACSYLAGAMAAMHAIAPRKDGLLTDLHRPAWILWPMSGRYPAVEIARERAGKKLVKA